MLNNIYRYKQKLVCSTRSQGICVKKALSRVQRVGGSQYPAVQSVGDIPHCVLAACQDCVSSSSRSLVVLISQCVTAGSSSSWPARWPVRLHQLAGSRDHRKWAWRRFDDDQDDALSYMFIWALTSWHQLNTR